MEAAQSILAPLPGVQEIQIEVSKEGDPELNVNFNGDKVAIAHLLKQLVVADVPVLAFNEETDTLEDLFMKLTKGIVS